MIHKPWWGENNFSKTSDYTKEFYEYISSDAPDSLKMGFFHAQKVHQDRFRTETVSKTTTIRDDDMNEDDQDIFWLSGKHTGRDPHESFARVPKGENYDWSKKHVQNRDIQISENDFLYQMIERDKEYCETTKEILLPLKTDGSEYEINQLRGDQRDIFDHIFMKFSKWWKLKNKTKATEKELVCMIIRGQAGSGKSTLDNTIVTTIRRMFQHTNSAVVCAPTGGSANQAGGETIHKLATCSVRGKNFKKLSTDDKDCLLKLLRTTVCLIVDERSLISNKLIAEMEDHIRTTAHGGKNKKLPWGGIPIVIFVGDDMQLPSIESGVLDLQFPYEPQDIPNNYKNACRKDTSKEEILGQQLWWNLSKDVMELKKILRTIDNDNKYKMLQSKSRLDMLENEDISEIYKYHIDNPESFTPDQRLAIETGAMFVFARKEDRDEHNRKMLESTATEENPVAVIKSQSCSFLPGCALAVKSHFRNDSNVTEYTPICRKCLVSIQGRNFMPKWGLFNGAVGTVVEILYEKEKKPNHGDLPTAVIVDMPGYVGPIWDKINPTVRKMKTYYPTMKCALTTILHTACSHTNSTIKM